MWITTYAGYRLATDLYIAVENGTPTEGLVSRAQEFGLGSQVESICRFRVLDDTPEGVAREMQIHSLAYSLGVKAGTRYGEAARALDDDDGRYAKPLRRYVQDTFDVIIPNREKYNSVLDAVEAGTLDFDLQSIRTAVCEALDECGVLLVAEHFYDGFVDGVALSWLRVRSSNLVAGLTEQFRQIARDPLRGPDELELKIQRETQVMTRNFARLSDRMLLMCGAERALMSRVADEMAHTALADRFVLEYAREENADMALDAARRELYRLYFELKRRGSTAGMASVSRGFSVLVSDSELHGFVRLAELGGEGAA